MDYETNIPIKIIIQHDDFDVNSEIKALTMSKLNIGSIVIFLGFVRDLSSRKNLEFMELEHYPGMTEKALKKISTEALERWNVTGISIIHRIGRLLPGTKIVLVLVASAHREQAFSAADFIMDFLKSSAPFWKKETTKDGSVWVDAKPSDAEALARWD